MRNCFVPRCDNMCKEAPRRMMFMAPKDAAVFNKWKEVLPKRREFKRTDKVCERHFSKDDIITTFDHVINGELLQMERDRPRLKPSAIPSKNLNVDCPPERTPTKRSTPIKPALKSKRTKFTAKRGEIKPAADNVVEEKQIDEAIATESVELEMSIVETIEGGEKETEESDGIVLEQFETLYDDIFEVTLPSTLWGVHREPERKFIAFTCFDLERMAGSKCVILTSSGCMKITYTGRTVSEQNFAEEITTEFISNILNEVDETDFCSKLSENCSILAEPESDCCSNCA